MIKNYFVVVFLAALTSCGNNSKNQHKVKQTDESSRIESLIEKFNNSQDDEILVIAHRAGWRNFPENSIQGIKYCIELNVDMIEIDVRETKDGELVLIHDKTLDRSTTGKGLVSDWTLAELKQLWLRNGYGVATPHKIPTLKEALLTAKGKILVNLDKSYDIFDKCYAVIKETGTENQVIIKGGKPKDKVVAEFGEYLDKVEYMPVVNIAKPGYNKMIHDFMENNPPKAIEFVFDTDTISLISKFDSIRKRGVSIWVNSLYPSINGGHEDDKAALDINEYDWYIRHNINMIQTDRPKLLLDYLKSRGYHE